MTRTQIEISIGLFLALLSATLLVVAGLQEEDRMLDREAEVVAAAIEGGAALFESNCSSCHGNQGLGIPGVAPALNEASFFNDRLLEVGWGGTLEDYIVSTVSAGRLVSTRPNLYVGSGVPAMPSWALEFGGPLRDDQIRDIAAYIMNFEKTAVEGVVVEVLPTPAPAEDTPETRGLAIYNERGCGACHQIPGVSEGVVGPGLSNIGTVAETRQEGVSAVEYLRESIYAPNAYLVDGYNEGLMPQNFQELITEPELEDLIAYLISLQ